MHDGVASGHRILDRIRITNIALNEGIAGILCDGFQVRQVPGVGEFVVVHDGVFLARRQYHTNEIRADETCAAGNKDFHARTSVRSPRVILLAPVSATKLLARNKDSNWPASVHQPSKTS